MVLKHGVLLLVLLLLGCATAELSHEDLTKVTSGDLVRIETENQETVMDFYLESTVSEVSGRMHDFKIGVTEVDSEPVYRKFGDASQVFALNPGKHTFKLECTHKITRNEVTNSFSQVDEVEIILEKGFWYQIRSRREGDKCRTEIKEYRLNLNASSPG